MDENSKSMATNATVRIIVDADDPTLCHDSEGTFGAPHTYVCPFLGTFDESYGIWRGRACKLFVTAAHDARGLLQNDAGRAVRCPQCVSGSEAIRRQEG